MNSSSLVATKCKHKHICLKSGFSWLNKGLFANLIMERWIPLLIHRVKNLSSYLSHCVSVTFYVWLISSLSSPCCNCGTFVSFCSTWGGLVYVGLQGDGWNKSSDLVVQNCWGWTQGPLEGCCFSHWLDDWTIWSPGEPWASLKTLLSLLCLDIGIEYSPQRPGTAGDAREDQFCPGDGCSFCLSNLGDGDRDRFMDA